MAQLMLVRESLGCGGGGPVPFPCSNLNACSREHVSSLSGQATPEMSRGSRAQQQADRCARSVVSIAPSAGCYIRSSVEALCKRSC